MDCEPIRDSLIGFHFGVVEDEDRGRIESHLIGCRPCLEEFLALKRDIELALESDERPSPAVHRRLRRAMIDQLRRQRAPVRPFRSTWERALACGLAAGAVAASLLAVQHVSSSPGAPPHGIGREAAVTRP
jgi:anti-sigma factor RsiW